MAGWRGGGAPDRPRPGAQLELWLAGWNSVEPTHHILYSTLCDQAAQLTSCGRRGSQLSMQTTRKQFSCNQIKKCRQLRTHEAWKKLKITWKHFILMKKLLRRHFFCFRHEMLMYCMREWWLVFCVGLSPHSPPPH